MGSRSWLTQARFGRNHPGRQHHEERERNDDAFHCGRRSGGGGRRSGSRRISAWSIGTEDGANRGVQLALFLVEALPRLAVDVFERSRRSSSNFLICSRCVASRALRVSLSRSWAAAPGRPGRGRTADHDRDHQGRRGGARHLPDHPAAPGGRRGSAGSNCPATNPVAPPKRNTTRTNRPSHPGAVIGHAALP